MNGANGLQLVASPDFPGRSPALGRFPESHGLQDLTLEAWYMRRPIEQADLPTGVMKYNHRLSS